MKEKVVTTSTCVTDVLLCHRALTNDGVGIETTCYLQEGLELLNIDESAIL